MSTHVGRKAMTFALSEYTFVTTNSMPAQTIGRWVEGESRTAQTIRSFGSAVT